MNRVRRDLSVALLMAAISTHELLAQRVGGGRIDRPIVGPSTIPAVESYPPAAAGLFEVVSVEPRNRTVRLRASGGKTADVSVAEHVYDLSKLKAGDKLKVDFFQPDEVNTKLSAAGIWPVR